MIDFQEFWLEYPRKVGKLKAERAWWRMREQDKQFCMMGLKTWKGSGDWQNIQFVPYPATFLNQRRYDDHPTFPPVFKVARPTKDYSAEVADILARHPDLK